MPATSVAVEANVSKYSQTGAAINWTAADPVNGNQTEIAGEVMLLVWNQGVSTRTVSITSEPDPATGRTGDVTDQDVAAGEIRHFKLPIKGWVGPDNILSYSGSHSDLKFAVIATEVFE